MDKPMSRIRKAVILAGGLGKRLMPLTRTIPKEMLPLGPKPILHHIVDELRGSGVEEIIIVSRKGKDAISEYFEGERDVRIIEKDKALGPGHSLMIVREHLGSDGFVVAFGDSPFAGKAPQHFIKKMISTHQALQAAVLIAVQKVPREETHLRGMVETVIPLDGESPAIVTALVQKPDPSASPGNWGVAGRYVFSPDIFDALSVVAGQATREILLADAVKHMLGQGLRVYALPVSQGLRRLDTGRYEGYLDACHVFSENDHQNP
jgi:UTP--glucose-1-phosphate uridylyltransferase